MKKLDEITVKEKLAEFKYKLLGPYVNLSVSSSLECPIGHKYVARIGNFFYRHARCPECEKLDISHRCKTPWSTILEIASSKNFQVLSTKEEYEQNHEKQAVHIRIACRCGKERIVSHTGLRLTKGCVRCKNGSEKRRKSYETIKKEIENIGYSLLTPIYKNNKQKLEVSCPIHGIFRINMNDLLDGHRCKSCSSGNSQQHMEIVEYLNKTCQILINDRTEICPLELDIYAPGKQLAIEYCGLYWHSEEKKERKYHSIKHRRCQEKGIQLITIFEDEWLERQDQVKNILTAKLGLLPKIAARKCQIKEITKQESDTFSNKYHLQGAAIASLYLGLFYEDTLVATITGGIHHRQGQGNVIVLNRLCFGPYAVVGGSSKLFKAFKEKAKSLGFSKIVSWSDNRWSTGKVYTALGFTLEEELPLDYSYCKGQKRISKQSCQKRMLLKKGAIGSTEREMALSLGYKRIWDCGKKRWTMTIY